MTDKSDGAEGTFMQAGHRLEQELTDRDGSYLRTTNFHETHLEQPQAPEDAVALISLGQHRVDKTHSMGRDRERKWIELTDGVYLNAGQAVELALLLLESAAQYRAERIEFEGPAGPVAHDDPRRWDLHVAACSIADMTFWVRKLPDGQYAATEVESGCTSAPGSTAQGAMENYWERRYA